MSDIIQILPDSVANQIAAGEVVQRPASVVKELVENAIDAGSTSIKVNIKDAGKTLIQVIDNGCGMSESDTRRAFERHATSKINKASDLFAIRSMGFRGEALASIAAIANVELKTKRINDELGTHLNINGSEFISQQNISCPDGSNFIVKNLFFNVPARRKFLKSNSAELRHIINEFQRITIANSDISFELIHNDSEIYNLPAGNIRTRLTNIFNRNINSRLISINTETNIVKITGFIGKPEYAKKSSGEQFFFVNNRFMRHHYFHKAVTLSYDKILPHNTIPSYFIFLDVDPKIIDINIHPCKTEIKFEDEQSIFQIIKASINEALGKFNVVPSIDFEEDTSLEIPAARKNQEIKIPGIKVNPNYNPFDEERKSFENNYHSNPVPKEWERLYDNDISDTENGKLFSDSQSQNSNQKQLNLKEYKNEKTPSFFHLKNKYILTSVRSGLMIIDQRKAHERILFEKFLISLENKQMIAQQTLFPKTMELNPSDYSLLQEIIDDVRILGFDIQEFSKNVFVINGTPADIQNCDPITLLENLIENYKLNQTDIKIEVKENVAKSLAKAAAINYGKSLSKEEMSIIVDQLFACKIPNYTFDGKKIISIIEMHELEKLFK